MVFVCFTFWPLCSAQDGGGMRKGAKTSPTTLRVLGPCWTQRNHAKPWHVSSHGGIVGTTGDIGPLYKIYVCVRGINTAILHLRHHILSKNQDISLGDCKSSPDARKVDGKDGYFKEIFGIVLSLMALVKGKTHFIISEQWLFVCSLSF